jgi:hypothetical protein
VGGMSGHLTYLVPLLVVLFFLAWDLSGDFDRRFAERDLHPNQCESRGDDYE